MRELKATGGVSTAKAKAVDDIFKCTDEHITELKRVRASAWIQCVDTVHGYYAWMQCMDTVRGYSAWILCMDAVHGYCRGSVCLQRTVVGQD